MILSKVIGNPSDNTLITFFPREGGGLDSAGWLYIFPDTKEPEPAGLSVLARYGPPEFPPGSVNDGFDGYNDTVITIHGKSRFTVPAGPPINGRKTLYWGFDTENTLEFKPLRIYELRSP